MIISPCISICNMDSETGLCEGCKRTTKEKTIWKDKNTTDEWKLNNLEEIKKRMDVKTLNYFKESYEFKLKNGISLIKKRKLDEQKQHSNFDLYYWVNICSSISRYLGSRNRSKKSLSWIYMDCYFFDSTFLC